MEELYDVIIVGGGPAGLAAALYLARAKYSVAVLEKACFGGQIALTDEVVNYPGVVKTGGVELAEAMRCQAESFGAQLLSEEMLELDMGGQIKTVRTDRGERKALSVLLATGAHPRAVGFKGEEEFRGRGVSHCATCDGAFFAGREVFVVGGGYAAAQEALFLAKFARHVTILIRREGFSCATAVADAARSHPGITVLPHTEVEEVLGDSAVRAIRYRNRLSGDVTERQAAEGESFGVFVFAGYAPASELVKGLVELDEQGYVLTGRHFETCVDGLYAAGDVRAKKLRQVATAVGDGVQAAAELEHYVDARRSAMAK